MGAFVPKHDNPLPLYPLRLLRRFLFRRYAFGAASEVNRILGEHHPGPGTRLWLWKDRCLPRVGLSLVIGFGAVLGAGHLTDWLAALARPRRIRALVDCQR